MDAAVVEARLDSSIDELVLLDPCQSPELGSDDLGCKMISATLVHDLNGRTWQGVRDQALDLAEVGHFLNCSEGSRDYEGRRDPEAAAFDTSSARAGPSGACPAARA